MTKHPKFTTIDFPGGIGTQPTAITPSGEIVGRYVTPATGQQHGFLLTKAGFTSIDVPKGSDTEVNWMNPSGHMVGDYRSPDGNLHGFLRIRGKFKSFIYPGATDTNAFGISLTGDIVGAHFPHGYLRTRQGKFIPIDFPEAFATFASMINGNTILGFYLEKTVTNDIVPHTYLFSRGKYKEVTIAGWKRITLTGLNPQGHMTGGGTLLADGLQHGLVLRLGKISKIDFPGSVPGSSYVNSINTRGDMVGVYQAPDLSWHGFLRTKH
jgi:hypothetical protein